MNWEAIRAPESLKFHQSNGCFRNERSQRLSELLERLVLFCLSIVSFSGQGFDEGCGNPWNDNIAVTVILG